MSNLSEKQKIILPKECESFMAEVRCAPQCRFGFAPLAAPRGAFGPLVGRGAVLIFVAGAAKCRRPTDGRRLWLEERTHGKSHR